MAVSQFTAAFALALITISLTSIQPSACHVVKSSVSCIDCDRHYDLSGISVMIKCDRVKKLGITTTKLDGSFDAELPLDSSLTPASNCQAKVLGGPEQLYALEENKGSKVVMEPGQSNAYTTVAPLMVAKSCSSFRKYGKCVSPNGNLGSSKTIDLPIPPEYGLPPTSLYFPVIPIIGIP
ncbi:hypothetical protein Ancab_011277 [Ancistrocladus abbreviatus]